MFHTGRICHIWCDRQTCRTSIIFGAVKDSSLKMYSLSLNNCSRYRNVLQNGVNSLAKVVEKKNSGFCPKAQNVVDFGPYHLTQASPVRGVMSRRTHPFLKNVAECPIALLLRALISSYTVLTILSASPER